MTRSPKPHHPDGNPLYNNIKDFQKLKDYTHHEGNRYDHCLRVAYYTYKVTKRLNLNYKEATIAALVHDFFTNEVENETILNARDGVSMQAKQVGTTNIKINVLKFLDSKGWVK